jgi:hypothetical protein
MTIGGNPNNGITNYRDICCADYVSLALRAAGLDYHWTGADNNSNTRRANYYNPCPASADHLRQLGPNEPYLPGDILTYSYGAPNAQHVNLYIGDLRGTVTLWRNGALTPMSYRPGDGYTLLEGSLNTGPSQNSNKNNQPASPSWYAKTAWTKRVRLLELEAAYRQAGML